MRRWQRDAPCGIIQRVTDASLSRIYFNRRMITLAAIGFASGLPSASKLLGSTLQTWLDSVQIDIETIGAFSLVTLPLALNFVWAPLLDRFVPPFLGRRRGWMLVFQLLLIVGIIVMALVGPREAGDSLRALAVMALVVAFLTASNDVVSDAYRADVLPAEELGTGAAWFVNGYRIAMMLAGGGALMLSQYLSWPTIYMMLASLMFVGVVGTLLAPEPVRVAPPESMTQAVVEPAHDFWLRLRWRGVLLLLFVALFKIPDSMANTMTMPLLLKLEFSAREIANVREWLGLAIVMIGAWVGGGIIPRIGMVPSLWLFGIAQALSNLGFLVLTLTGKSIATLVVVVVIENFCAGLVTVGFIAFLMGQCNRRYSATQYAMFTSIMFGTGALLGPACGWIVEHHGFANFFIATLIAALPGLLLLCWIREPAAHRDPTNN